MLTDMAMSPWLRLKPPIHLVPGRTAHRSLACPQPCCSCNACRLPPGLTAQASPRQIEALGNKNARGLNARAGGHHGWGTDLHVARAHLRRVVRDPGLRLRLLQPDRGRVPDDPDPED